MLSTIKISYDSLVSPRLNLEITFEEPLFHDNSEVSDETKMLEINSIIEKWIKQNPDNWFWQHKIFN